MEKQQNYYNPPPPQPDWIHMLDPNRTPHIPAASVSHLLLVSEARAAGQQVWMFSINDFQVIPAAHFHLFGLLLKQDLTAQLVKQDAVHLWLLLSPQHKLNNVQGLVRRSPSVSCGTK